MTNTKKGFLIAAILVLFAVSGAFAQTTGNIQLIGSVPEILKVIVTSDAIAGTLDLSVDVVDLKVGSVTEVSNKRLGYTVSVESLNAKTTGAADAYFKSDDGTNTDELNYDISYGGVAVTLSGGEAVVSDQSVKTAAAGSPNDVAITYSGAAGFLYEDSYKDTLTFTIAAK